MQYHFFCLKFSYASHSLPDKRAKSESCYAILAHTVTPIDHSLTTEHTILQVLNYFKFLANTLLFLFLFLFLASHLHHPLSGSTFPSKPFRLTFDITSPLFTTCLFPEAYISYHKPLSQHNCIYLVNYLSTY